MFQPALGRSDCCVGKLDRMPVAAFPCFYYRITDSSIGPEAAILAGAPQVIHGDIERVV
jgi:hypothetical protein